MPLVIQLHSFPVVRGERIDEPLDLTHECCRVHADGHNTMLYRRLDGQTEKS